MQATVDEPEETEKRPFWSRVANGWTNLNSKLKSIF